MKILLGIVILAALLAITINSESLWTDEAFSAFIASHRTLASCWSTLASGDSSDLQMVFYYLYLHVWTQVFGQSEIAFRTANIPFILLYSSVLVWASYRLFQSPWAWIIAALAPLAITFSNDTRPYFDVISLSLSCVTCLLVYLMSPTERERRVMPWLVILLLLFGATFHMLMLLLGPPLFVLLAVFYLADKSCLRWPDWKWPLIAFTPVALVLAGYFAWTFRRGATYDYAKPDLLSMASVLFRFAGLSGYSPNRRYDIPFTPFLGAMALATAALIAGLVALYLASSKSDKRVCFNALFLALATAMAQICALSLGLHQQIEFRHLSSLLPLLLLLIMAGLAASPQSKLAAFAALAIGVTWLGSDVRLLLSPDYAREDFRSAAGKSIQLHNATNADIALAADPVAAAYYGLEVEGPKPCFPLTDSCQEGFAKVPWPKRVPAQYALFWHASQINAWMDEHKRSGIPMVLLISRGRHPIIKGSAWWPIMNSRTDAKLTTFFGFYVYWIP